MAHSLRIESTLCGGHRRPATCAMTMCRPHRQRRRMRSGGAGRGGSFVDLLADAPISDPCASHPAAGPGRAERSRGRVSQRYVRCSWLQAFVISSHKDRAPPTFFIRPRALPLSSFTAPGPSAPRHGTLRSSADPPVLAAWPSWRRGRTTVGLFQPYQ